MCAAMSSVSKSDAPNQDNGWQQSMSSTMATPIVEVPTPQRLEGRGSQIKNFAGMQPPFTKLECIDADGELEEKKKKLAQGVMRTLSTATSVGIANSEEGKPSCSESKTDGFTPQSKFRETKSHVVQTPDELNAKLEAVGVF